MEIHKHRLLLLSREASNVEHRRNIKYFRIVIRPYEIADESSLNSRSRSPQGWYPFLEQILDHLRTYR